MKFIKDFKEIGTKDVPIAGGKGANFGSAIDRPRSPFL